MGNVIKAQHCILITCQLEYPTSCAHEKTLLGGSSVHTPPGVVAGVVEGVAAGVTAGVAGGVAVGVAAVVA